MNIQLRKKKTPQNQNPREVKVKTSHVLEVFLHSKTNLLSVTWTIAGSWGKEHCGFGGSQTVRSLISLPRNMMYSKTSSRGGIGRSVGLSSVPKDRTGEKENMRYMFYSSYSGSALRNALFQIPINSSS